MGSVRAVLSLQHRLHDMTLQTLLEIGVLQFCWLTPNEHVGPYDGSLWPRGAFAYFYAEEHAAACDCIFALDDLAGMSAIPPLRRWQASGSAAAIVSGGWRSSDRLPTRHTSPPIAFTSHATTPPGASGKGQGKGSTHDHPEQPSDSTLGGRSSGHNAAVGRADGHADREGSRHSDYDENELAA